jgi:NAD+ kinase
MRVLVVYKQSFLESHRGEVGLLRRLEPAERTRLLRDDRENKAALREVVRTIEKAGAQPKVVYRGNLAASPLYDLIITVGGDGTFFMAAHRAHGTPILGVNSVPTSSLGLFSAANRSTFAAMLEKALERGLPALQLNRMTILINDRARPELALNDVLIAHPSPAALSRFSVSVDGGKAEVQRSSGIWISTAAGSTAAIRAAGGRRMPLASRRLQYLVREPYYWPSRPRLRHGYAKTAIELRVLMNQATLWVDGVRTRIELDLGDRVRLETGAEPATVLGVDVRRRDRLFP